MQGRRRVFNSGPAEETIECRRDEKGESTRGGAREGEHERGIIPPLVRGVWGSPPRFVFNFERFYVRF